jgi:cytochrome c-type biogenesis protein CcmH
MLLFVTACALITAMLVCVVALWQRRAPVDGLAHAKALYAAFVSDVDRRERRGEIDAELGNEERVEAARALLKAEAGAAPATVARPAVVAGLIFIAAAVTFVIYILFVGHPLAVDQPYQARLKAWTRAAQQNPYDVSPEVLAAVLHQGADRNTTDPRLRQVVAHNLKDPAFWSFLAQKDLEAGNAYLAAKEFETAERLAPDRFTAWSDLGASLALISGGTIGRDAKIAFDKALALNPADTRAHYYLGRMNLNAGDYAAARGHFTTALSGLAPDDARRNVIADELKAVDIAEKGQAAMKTRVAGMVAGLAAQLKAEPDNPDGWARLLRSYDVLGDAAARSRAEADMKAHYRDRPDIAQSILARAQSAVGAENTGGQ